MIDKIKEIRISGNSFYVILILIIIGGYLFFFNSKDLFAKNEILIKATELNEVNTYSNRDFKIVRWDYSEKEDICEIELDILNNNFDGLNEYDVAAYVRKNGQEKELQVEKIIKESTLLILQIKDIPKQYAEICLKVNLPEEEEVEPLKLYATRDSVKRLSKLPKRSKEEYQLNRLKLQIEQYEKDIITCEDDIEVFSENIESCKDQIKELKAEMEYQTNTQKEETQRIIDAAYTEMGRLESEIEKKGLEIKEIQASIKQIKSKLS